jgi:hypothetical protein
MQSTQSAMRIRRQNEIFREYYDSALKALKKGKSIRVPTRVAKSILLHYPTIDDKYSTQVRNIGAGIKELYLKEIL